ncbi:MAG: enolase [Candidatus Staskawiczbacteria bacterium]|nr:enolase [Candidatus Staskawiczbacteria bacterium]
MSKIKSIVAREIKDSRGNPTIEVELETDKGIFVDSVPSGASTGVNEAAVVEVQQAIKNVNEIIAPKLKGQDVLNQKAIDNLLIELDGTENKSKLGANAILAVSLAVCRAGAASKKIPLYQHISELAVGRRTSHRLPMAMFNILNGGAHVRRTPSDSRGVDKLAIQEFMVIPDKNSFAESLISCNKIFNNLKENIEKNFGKENLDLGDEGGFAPPISNIEQALYLLKNAVDGETDVKFALDCAASEFYKDGKYKIDGRELARTELLEFYEDLVKRFDIISIEDPFSQEDWQGFESIVRQLGEKITIVGDDLTTTNIKRIKEAHNKLACNGVILKLNQIGTVSETIEACNLAKSYGWKTIVSHRSGETMDNFIADLAVGLGADFLKAGSPAKEERMVKYQRLLEIEKELK